MMSGWHIVCYTWKPKIAFAARLILLVCAVEVYDSSMVIFPTQSLSPRITTHASLSLRAQSIACAFTGNRLRLKRTGTLEQLALLSTKMDTLLGLKLLLRAMLHVAERLFAPEES